MPAFYPVNSTFYLYFFVPPVFVYFFFFIVIHKQSVNLKLRPLKKMFRLLISLKKSSLVLKYWSKLVHFPRMTNSNIPHSTIKLIYKYVNISKGLIC